MFGPDSLREVAATTERFMWGPETGISTPSTAHRLDWPKPHGRCLGVTCVTPGCKCFAFGEKRGRRLPGIRLGLPRFRRR